ncbi:MAG: peptidoglycan D,D-transpeptidase FtsI family protein [Planctomycetota bacterium]
MRSTRLIIFLFAFLIVAFVSLSGRCLYLQLVRNDYYSGISSKQRVIIPQKPRRGAILDCRGRVLAASNKIQTIFADPMIIDDIKSVANRLGAILDMNSHEIYKIIASGKNPRYVKIKSTDDYEKCRRASAIYGVGVETDWVRYYPMGNVAAHVVGFISRDNRGLGGIEFGLDKELAGEGSTDVYVSDISKRPIKLKKSEPALKDGVEVILTIDATIQQFVREELLSQYESFEAESAVAIVAEPKTGAILALVSLPDFDYNDVNSYAESNLCNRAITEQFEPGSILKPIVAAISLDAGVIEKDKRIFCENGSYSGKGFGQIGEYGNRAYGNLTVREILVASSNIGMAKIGQRLGRERLYEGLIRFGFGKKTGFGLPGEAEGLLRPTDKWTGYSVTRIPFGQEISVTAIQLLRSFCILANSGRYVQPFLVRAIIDSGGRIVEVKHPSPSVGFVISPEVADWIVRDALVGVVNEGTGKRAKLEKWQMFGKTGTADIAKSDERGYDEWRVIASFAGGAPAEEPALLRRSLLLLF